jgi:hypothetical protein
VLFLAVLAAHRVGASVHLDIDLAHGSALQG